MMALSQEAGRLGQPNPGDGMIGKPFDLVDGIFFFFKRFGANPLGGLWLLFWHVLILVGAGALVMTQFLPQMLDFVELAERIDTSGMDEAAATAAVFEALGPLMGWIPLIFFGGIVIALMLQGAWLRFLVRNEIAAGIPVRFGGDEFRLLGVNILYIVIGSIAYFSGVIGLFTVIGGGAALIGLDEASTGGAIGFGLVTFASILIILAAAIFLAVKLASAPALTIADRKFRFFESWEASNGVFWPMLLSYLVVIVIISTVGSVLSLMVQFMLLGAVMPVIGELVQRVELGREVELADLMAVYQDLLQEPALLASLVIGGFLWLAVQIIGEAMFHSVAAYNAVRARADGAVEMGDAPVLDRDHPAGPTPSLG